MKGAHSLKGDEVVFGEEGSNACPEGAVGVSVRECAKTALVIEGKPHAKVSTISMRITTDNTGPGSDKFLGGCSLVQSADDHDFFIRYFNDKNGTTTGCDTCIKVCKPASTPGAPARAKLQRFEVVGGSSVPPWFFGAAATAARGLAAGAGGLAFAGLLVSAARCALCGRPSRLATSVLEGQQQQQEFMLLTA
uniref:Uncharacterized protein n=1 Tax=Zooxanthella nutricula TaxID=1333877 RepID=A0A7S2JBH1_9DINO